MSIHDPNRPLEYMEARAIINYVLDMMPHEQIFRLSGKSG